MPTIAVEKDEPGLVFSSNAMVSLSTFDSEYVATRQIERARSA